MKIIDPIAAILGKLIGTTVEINDLHQDTLSLLFQNGGHTYVVMNAEYNYHTNATLFDEC